jgi:hypothetical protein
MCADMVDVGVRVCVDVVGCVPVWVCVCLSAGRCGCVCVRTCVGWVSVCV